MSKSKFIIEKFAKLFEQGIISYKDLSEEIVNIVRSQRDEIVLSNRRLCHQNYVEVFPVSI